MTNTNHHGMDVQATFNIPFTQVQNTVIESPYFNKPIDKMVYITLLKFAFNKGHAFPSIKTISVMQNVSENTVRTSIKRLEKMNLVSVEKRTDEKKGNLSNLYYIYDLSYEYSMEHYKKQQEELEKAKSETIDNSTIDRGTSNFEGGYSKNCRGVLQNLQGGTSNFAPEEYSFNNIKINNIKGNNNLSINESASTIEPGNNNQDMIDRQIDSIDLPDSIKKHMIRNIHRIQNDSISLEDIEDVYHANKDFINPYRFGYILANVLQDTKDKIRDIQKLLYTAIRNDGQPAENNPDHSKQKKENVPDWFESRKKHSKKQEELEPHELEEIEKRFNDYLNSEEGR